MRPTLIELASIMPTPEVAVILVGETLWHEGDRLRALGQYPRRELGDTSVAPGSLPVFGPGLGIASIEEPTWDWMAGTSKGKQLLFAEDYSNLASDLRLNVVACRLRYFLSTMALPKLEDGIEARATYWWKVYNCGQVDRRPDYLKNATAIPWAL